ncbi:MAG: hypothetical protein NWF07_15935, partial [Candidatus Bathyarchaeota archaeon]|nr:hypothetical protein [Candidatus Bathyarchaeota archaeon]
TTAVSRVITLSNKDLYKISLVDLKTYTMLVLNLARDISRRLRGADEMLAMVKNRATMPTSSSQGDASL